MRLIAFLALLGIVGVGVLGFVAIRDIHENGIFCISNVVIPKNCPKSESSAFQVGIYKNLSAGIILALLTLSLLVFARILENSVKQITSLLTHSKNFELVRPIVSRNQTAWFEIHEKRDPA